jgi:hypothetical protein
MDIWQTPCSQLRPNAAIPFVSAGMSSYTRLVAVNLKKQRQEPKIKTDRFPCKRPSGISKLISQSIPVKSFDLSNKHRTPEKSIDTTIRT